MSVKEFLFGQRLDGEHCAMGGQCEDAVSAVVGRLLPEVRVTAGDFYVAPDGETFDDLGDYFDYINGAEGG